MNKRNNLAVLLLFSLIFVSACTVSTGHQIQSVEKQANEQSSAGIEKGQTPPDFTISTIEGKEIKLSQFRDDKPILLYFWATWCPYCKQDFNVVRNIYPKYKDQVAFLSID